MLSQSPFEFRALIERKTYCFNWPLVQKFVFGGTVVNNAGNSQTELEKITWMGIKGWRKDEEDKCVKENEEDVCCSGKGQNVRPHSGGGEWVKGSGMRRENARR